MVSRLHSNCNCNCIYILAELVVTDRHQINGMISPTSRGEQNGCMCMVYVCMVWPVPRREDWRSSASTKLKMYTLLAMRGICIILVMNLCRPARRCSIKAEFLWFVKIFHFLFSFFYRAGGGNEMLKLKYTNSQLRKINFEIN